MAREDVQAGPSLAERTRERIADAQSKNDRAKSIADIKEVVGSLITSVEFLLNEVENR